MNLRSLLLLLGIFIVFSATIDPELLWEIRKARSKPTKAGITPLSVPAEQKYNVLIVTRGKVWENPIICGGSYCIYGRRLTRDEIFSLAKDSRVLSIRKPRKYKLMLWNAIPMINGTLVNRTVMINETSYIIPENIIQIPGRNLTGKGVKIAIIDSGINPNNPWFKDAKIIYNASVRYDDKIGCVFTEGDYIDEDGHGTHVAGIIHSIAPDAELIIFKVSFPASDYDILCAIRKALELNASIISMSLGADFYYFTTCPTPTYDPLCYYVNNYSNKALFVIAAGNSGADKFHYNATGNSSITISVNNAKWIEVLVRAYNNSNFNISLSNDNETLIKIVNDIVEEKKDNVKVAMLKYFGQKAYVIRADRSYSTLYLNISGDCEYDIYSIYFNGTDILPSDLTPYSKWSTISSPGIAEKAITVGSVVSSKIGWRNQPYGHISLFSSRGPLRHNYSIIKPEVVAPGDIIASANYSWPNSSYIAYMAGTSMATPIVSGIAAIVKQVCPSCTPDEVKKAIILSADNNSYNLGIYTVYEKGYGLVNISKLVNEVLPRIDLINYTNETWNTINITLRNIGKISAKSIKINGTNCGEIGKEGICRFVPNLPAGKYNITLNISGEFLNSPLLENISVTLLSKVVVEQIVPINYSNNTLTLNITLRNEAPYKAINCSLSIAVNGSELFNETIGNISKNKNIIANLSGIQENQTISITINVECPYDSLNQSIAYNNVLVDYGIFNITGKESFSLFEDAIFILNSSLLTSDFNLNISSCMIERINLTHWKTICKKGALVPRNYTLNITPVWNDLNITNESKCVKFEIREPNISMSVKVINTRNETFFGKNSSFEINITNNDLSFNGTLYMLIGNNSFSESFFVEGNNKTIVRIAPQNFSEEGRRNVTFYIKFGAWKSSNITKKITFDFTDPVIRDIKIEGYTNEINGTYYTNKSNITISVSAFDENFDGMMINGEGSHEENTTKIINLTLGLNHIEIVAFDKANNSARESKEIIFDNESPSVIPITKYCRGISWIAIGIEDNISGISNISVESPAKLLELNYSPTRNLAVAIIEANCSEGVTVIAEDYAKNINRTKLVFEEYNMSKIKMSNEVSDKIIIEGISANETVEINISYGGSKTETKNGKIYRNESYIINISKPAGGLIRIKIKRLPGYSVESVLMKKNDELISLLESGFANISNDYIETILPLIDPEIIIVYSKPEVTSTPSTGGAETTGGVSIGGGFVGEVAVEETKPYFNVTMEKTNSTTIVKFERYEIENRTIELNLSYLKGLTIIPIEDIGKVEIRKLDIKKYLDFEVFAAYEIVPENCTIILNIERAPVILVNMTSFHGDFIKISGKTRLLFGRTVVKVVPMERNVTRKNITEITKENITETKVEKKAEEKKSLKIILILLIITVAIVLAKIIRKFT